MINVLILSKDRACQLDLLFQSINKFCPHIFNEIKIIYKSSNEDYENGYKKLINKTQSIESLTTFPTKELPFCYKIVWEQEKDFYPDFIKAIENCSSSLICGLTDDCLFYKSIKVSSQEIEDCFTDDVFTFTFRMGVNTIIQNYMTGQLQPSLLNDKLIEVNNGKIIKWNWKNKYMFDNYGYPISLDSHIYKTEELLKISTVKQFTCLRQWEGELSQIIRQLTPKEYMASFPTSVLFNIPANCVQDPPLISGTEFPYSIEELNQKYLNGEILDLDFILNNNKAVYSSHKETEFKFKNEN